MSRITMLDKIYHVQSGCPDCSIVKTPGFNDVRIADSCLARLRSGLDHECNDDAEVDYDICTDCGEHAGFCSHCGASNCCGAGSYETE